MDSRQARVRTIKTLAHRPSMTVMRTTQGHTVIGEDLDMWDLVLPELTWTGATYDERLAARAGQVGVPDTRGVQAPRDTHEAVGP